MNPNGDLVTDLFQIHVTNDMELLPSYEQTQSQPYVDLLAQQSARVAMGVTPIQPVYVPPQPPASYQILSQQQQREALPGTLTKKDKKMKKLKDDLRNAEQKKTELGESLKTLERKNDHLERRIVQLNDDIDRVRQENGSLIGIRNKLSEELNGVRAVNVSQNKDINALQEENQRQKKEIQFLRTDNDSLRTVIFRNENDLSLLNSEEHYIQTFEELRGDLERWVARASKVGGEIPLPQIAEMGVLGMLETLGPKAKASAEFLRANQTIRVWYKHIGARIDLVRHLVGVFLFDQIFEPFAVGLPSELRDALLWIDNDLISHERQFRKMLRIRQALCCEAMRYATSHNKGIEASLVGQMTRLLHLALPTTSTEDIGKAAERFINKSIKLKHAMTEESAVYSCHWVNSGECFDENQAEQGADEAGPVYICTFPGLSRTVDRDGATMTICAVKASVILQSAFIG